MGARARLQISATSALSAIVVAPSHAACRRPLRNGQRHEMAGGTMRAGRMRCGPYH